MCVAALDTSLASTRLPGHHLEIDRASLKLPHGRILQQHMQHSAGTALDDQR